MYSSSDAVSKGTSRHCSFSVAASVISQFLKWRARKAGNIQGPVQGCTCFHPCILRPQCLILSCSLQLRGWPCHCPSSQWLWERQCHSGRCGAQWKNSPRLLYSYYLHLLHSKLPLPPNLCYFHTYLWRKETQPSSTSSGRSHNLCVLRYGIAPVGSVSSSEQRSHCLPIWSGSTCPMSQTLHFIFR